MTHRLVAALLLVALATPTGIPAQQQLPSAASADSVKGVELKGKAPVNPQTLRVKLPRPQEATLANGLNIALIEDHKLPTFSLQLAVRGGGLADPADRRGLAMVTAALLREGTKQRSSRELAEQLAALGANLNTGASLASGESSVSVTGLVENIDAILDLFAEVVRNPAFPADELDKYRARYLSQLQYQRALPGFLAQEQFMRVVYGEHPAGYIVAPEPVLKALRSEDLAKYHAAYYRPNNAILVAYGDITLAQLTAKLERSLGAWQKGEVPPLALSPVSTPTTARVLLVDRPGSVQSSLWVGGLGIERKSEDYFAVLVMNHILGGGPASRLFMNLREDKGYTYGVSSFFNGSLFPGVMIATTDVRTAVTEGAMQELMGEIKRIGAAAVTAEELTNARRALIGRFALSLDSPQALLGNVLTQKIYGFPASYWDTYPQQVEAVTPADIQRVARKYYAGERLQIVAVGDAAQVRKTLEKYGTVETPAARGQ
jgi:zinc protease